MAWCLGLVFSLVVQNTVARAESVTAISTETSAEGTVFKWTLDKTVIEIRFSPGVQFKEDYSDVNALKPRAYFILQKIHPGRNTRFEIKAGAGQSLERSLWVNKKKVHWTDESQKEFTAAMLHAVRVLGFDASNRAKLILTQKGAEGLIAEINLLESENAVFPYNLELLLSDKEGGLHSRQSLGTALTRFKRDYFKAQTICSLEGGQLQNLEIRKLVVQLLRSLHSDYEQARSSTHLLKQGFPLAEILATAHRMSSDFEKSRILLEASAAIENDRQVRDEYFKLHATLHSDFEKSKCLQAVLSARNQPEPETISNVLNAAHSIQSGFEKSQLLRRTLKSSSDLSEPAAAAFFALLDSVGSPYEHRQAITEVFQNKRPGKPMTMKAISSASRIQNDFEKATALLAIVPFANEDQEIRTALTEASRTIRSDFERGRVLSALFK